MEAAIHYLPAAAMNFHSTRRNEALPILPLITILKASTALEMARTAGRIALTLIPVILMKNHTSRKMLKHAEAVKENNPNIVMPCGMNNIIEKKKHILRKIKLRTYLFHALMFTPFFIFWAAILASMERTPLTGRWRLILLSPQEEDEIAAQLAGSGWYQAVGDIITKDSVPRLVPPSDWRFAWVRDTLRQLETVIPTLGHERLLGDAWLERGPDDSPLPPPTDYPLRPRPRGIELLRMFCHLSHNTASMSPHNIPGPPYSLIVVDDPNSCNAFSYGFGPDGAGGIVVFSGFLDSVLRAHPALEPQMRTHHNVPNSEETSWWSYLFGSFLTVTPPVQQYQPTQEQTAELAILLAHELSHLILSHHLETLSSRTIVLPFVLSIVADVVRTLLFPVTMLFGPFVNDAVGQMGSALGKGELSKLGEYCTSVKQEIEADVVSARLLAHAGFDPRNAVQFWEQRRHADAASTAECTPGNAAEKYRKVDGLAMRIMGNDHPVDEVRVEKLRGELQRWRDERERAVAALLRQHETEMGSSEASQWHG
ncbi:hypothetical protein DENSPDRAFT_769340 [Dentipellis sp. KUC8613]|nr:hypothetical protein DENSPDRAFT_769340 [Dentipellis sp. KUC8613]